MCMSFVNKFQLCQNLNRLHSRERSRQQQNHIDHHVISLECRPMIHCHMVHPGLYCRNMAEPIPKLKGISFTIPAQRGKVFCGVLLT